MVEHGFADPRKVAPPATRSATALAVILGGGCGGGGDSVTALSSPTLFPPSCPLFSAVFLRATSTTIAGEPGGGNGAASPDWSATATVTDPDYTAANARLVVASSCAALHRLLRSEGNVDVQGNVYGTESGGYSVPTAATAVAQALAPTLEAFVSLSCGTMKDPAEPSSPATVGWRRGGNPGNAGGSAPPGAHGDTVGSDGTQAHDGSWQEANRAASLLLDFVDGFVETTSVYEREKQCRERSSGSRALHHMSGLSQFQQSQADDEVFSPPPHTQRHQHQQLTKQPSLGNRAMMKKVWAEVRGLCRGEVGAIAASSRWLAAVLNDPEDSEGTRRGGVRVRETVEPVMLSLFWHFSLFSSARH